MLSSTSSSSSTSPMVVTPEVLWAQRLDKVFLTIQVHDVEQPHIQLLPTKIQFDARAEGTGAGMEVKHYKVELELFKEIDTEKSTYTIAPRQVNFVLMKKEADMWPRCLQTSTKPFWLKTDFSKYQDEEEDEESNVANDPNDFMKSFGGSSMMDFSQFNPATMGGSAPPSGMMMDSDDDEEDDKEEEEVNPSIELEQGSPKLSSDVASSSVSEEKDASLAVSS